MAFSKYNRRKKVKYRIRNKISGTSARPRLSVFRSNKEIYCQLIDDVNGITLAYASSSEATVPKDKNKVEQSAEVGKLLAQRAKEKDVTRVVLDRGGYLYHGRVKALADGAREGGLIF